MLGIKLIFISIALVITTTCPTLAQQASGDAQATRADILKLFKVMHVREVYKQAWSGILEQTKRKSPGTTDADLAKIDAQFDQFYSGLQNDMISIYRKHFTKPVVAAMIRFYSTARGQEFLKQQPAVSQESMMAFRQRLAEISNEAEGVHELSKAGDVSRYEVTVDPDRKTAEGQSASLTPAPGSGAPDWLLKGSGAFRHGKDGALYGVGVAQGLNNKNLAVEASNKRAISEIGMIMNDYVQVLRKVYGMGRASAEPPARQGPLRITVYGAKIVDHWRNTDGTMFALCVLDGNGIQQTLDNIKELDDATRSFAQVNARGIFDDLQVEETKAR